jgi:hypothetical protein
MKQVACVTTPNDWRECCGGGIVELIMESEDIRDNGTRGELLIID